MRIKLTGDDEGIRLDLWLSTHLPFNSRRSWQTIIARGEVLINGRPAPKGLSIRPGMELALPDYPTSSQGLPAGALKSSPPQANHGDTVSSQASGLEYLYIDDWLIAVNKPAGLPCHPVNMDDKAARPSASISSLVEQRHPETALGRDTPPDHPHVSRLRLQGGLLNRLDNSSSGVLLFARSLTAWESFAPVIRGDSGLSPMEAPRWNKWYLALCRGDLTTLAGGSFPMVIHAPIAHSARRGSPRMVAVTETAPDGSRHSSSAYRGSPRPAATKIEKARQIEDDLCLVVARIHRGQRHQIRCHLAGRGLPLAGDSLYGGGDSVLQEGGRNAPFFLHQFRIDLPHPLLGRVLHIEAALPEDRLGIRFNDSRLLVSAAKPGDDIQ